MLNEKMVTIKVSGYSQNEGEREFQILSKEELKKIIERLDSNDIFRKTYEKASGYTFDGIAYTYIDATNGEVITNWLQQNNELHPYDSFKEIQLCLIKTPLEEYSDEDILDDEELEDYKNWLEENDGYGTLEEFVEQKIGKGEFAIRYENWIEWLSEEYEINWDSVEEQVENLF